MRSDAVVDATEILSQKMGPHIEDLLEIMEELEIDFHKYEELQCARPTTSNLSKFFSLFTDVYNSSKSHEPVIEDGICKGKKQYYHPDILDKFLDTYMGLYPFWIGILLCDLSRYASNCSTVSFQFVCKTRDTNSVVENYFVVIKNAIKKANISIHPSSFGNSTYEFMRNWKKIEPNCQICNSEPSRERQTKKPLEIGRERTLVLPWRVHQNISLPVLNKKRKIAGVQENLSFGIDGKSK